jgi:acetyl esterase/lipase
MKSKQLVSLATMAAALWPVITDITNADAPDDQAEEAADPGQSFAYKTSGDQPRRLEVYFPPDHNPAQAKVPAIIFFHGGGWQGGDLTQFRAACRHFAERGLVAVTAEYRMHPKGTPDFNQSGESRKRVCITDAKSAIRWLKTKAAEFGIDPQKVIAGGGSAGGHVAVLATRQTGLDDPSDDTSIDTKAAAYVLFNPAFEQKDQTDREVDALQHIGGDMAPAIVFFGDQDSAWLPGWDAVYARLAEAGARVEYWQAPGHKHGFFNRTSRQRTLLQKADRFLASLGLLHASKEDAPAVGGGMKLELISAPVADRSAKPVAE